MLLHHRQQVTFPIPLVECDLSDVDQRGEPREHVRQADYFAAQLQHSRKAIHRLPRTDKGSEGRVQLSKVRVVVQPGVQGNHPFRMSAVFEGHVDVLPRPSVETFLSGWMK